MSDNVTLMLVDEDAMQLRALKRLFRLHLPHIAVHCFDSVSCAQEAYPELKPDIVMIDKIFTRGSGIEFLQEIQQALPQAIRVLYSANMTSEGMLASAGVAHIMLNKVTETEHLLSIMQRACCLIDFPVDSHTKAYLGKIDHLPVLPEVFQKLTNYLTQVPYPDNQQAGAIISEDVGVLTKIIQLANSPLFGGGHTIKKASEAVTRLGYDFVKCLVLTIGLFQKQDLNTPSRYRLLEESEAVSELMASMMIYLKCSKEQIDNAYLIGRLHNVGYLLVREDESPSIEDTALKGAYLLQLWGFDPELVNAVLQQASLRSDNHSLLGDSLHLAITIRYLLKMNLPLNEIDKHIDGAILDDYGLREWLEQQPSKC